MKQTGILGQSIFSIIGLKLCCLDKAAWRLACVVLKFSPSGFTIKYANWENRNFRILSTFHSFQFSSGILKKHDFNLLGFFCFIFNCLAFSIGYIGLIKPVPKLTSGLSGHKIPGWDLQSRYFWTDISFFLNMRVYFGGNLWGYMV